MKLNEYQTQCLVVEYLEIIKAQGKVVAYTAVNPRPNMEHVGQRMKAKKAGLNPGFPDLFIIYKYKDRFNERNVLCLELKIHPNKQTKEQKEWQKALEDAGIFYKVAYGYEEAKEIIDSLIQVSLR